MQKESWVFFFLLVPKSKDVMLTSVADGRRVVDQNVQAAKLGDVLLDASLHRLWNAYIDL